MTVGTIQEMCETTLLYLGNNIYGILRHRPFSIERPIPFDLNDMQKVHPLTYNDNNRHMFFEIRLNCDYELLVTEDEIFNPPDVKPIIAPAPKHITILDADYVPPGIYIKEEPVEEPGETTHRTIGEIISQLDYIAKAIKQEMLDTTTTVMDITHKHSSTCELNKYVERHGVIDNLRIEDIRTLIQADQAVFPEMIPVTTTTYTQDTGKIAASIIVHTESQPSTEDTLPVVTNPIPTTTAVTYAAGAINAGTKMPLPVVTSLVPSLGKDTTPVEAIGTPLHVVTLPGPSSSIEAPTPIMTTTLLHVVTDPTTSSDIGTVTALATQTVSRSSTSESNKQLKWSRIFNRPIELVPTPEVGEKDNELSQPIQSTTTETSGKNLTDKYYEVLTPSQDDVVCISHMDILNSWCTVQLEWLNKNTITSLKIGTSTLPSQSSSTESSDTKKSKKKPCYRPKRKPSRAQVRAQQIITARKKGKKSLTIQSHSLPPAEPRQPVTEVPTPTPTQDSSDDTIIYSLPPSPKKQSKKKQVTKFVIRTVGLKTHHDTDAVRAYNKKKNRNCKCFLCGDSFASTKLLNNHFRINHEGLDCIVCDKEFISPLSLKKHSYIHKLCTFNCSRCDKVLPI